MVKKDTKNLRRPPKEMPIQTVGRVLLSNGKVSQTDLYLATGFPSWKISRLSRRLEILGFIDVENEPRFTRGRPRKFCRLTSSGIEYFTDMLRKAGNGGNAGNHDPIQSVAKEDELCGQ